MLISKIKSQNKGVLVILFYGAICSSSVAQENSTSVNSRGHNLSAYNSSLQNPTFSIDRNLPNSLSLWAQWLNQSIDSDPSSLFINYTYGINDKSALGLGFYTKTDSLVSFTGAKFNYASTLALGKDIELLFGMNLDILYQSIVKENENPFEQGTVGKLTPGLRLKINNLSIGVALENAWTYNFKSSRRQNIGREFFGTLSNDFALKKNNDGTLISFLRPEAYIKTDVDTSSQYGVNTTYKSSRYWIQVGFNSIYGVSGGAGIKMFKKLALGGLVQISRNSDNPSKTPSFEIIASYRFSVPPKVEDNVSEEKTINEDELNKEKEKVMDSTKFSVNRDHKKSLKENRPRVKENSSNRKMMDTTNISIKKLDKTGNKMEYRNTSHQNIKDSMVINYTEKPKNLTRINKIANIEEQPMAVQQNDNSEITEDDIEIINIKGVRKGFYLIVNVYETELYFRKFLKYLNDHDLEPKSFFRPSNNYNYVFLKRCDTFAQALEIRDKNFNGRYKDKIWILGISDKLSEERILLNGSVATNKKSLDSTLVISPSFLKINSNNDSITNATLKSDEIEVVKVEDVQNGYYLIVNVFETKRYFAQFVRYLSENGFIPKSFFRKMNGYNYVYLRRFETEEEAIHATDSKFFGRYQDKIWILNVRN